MIGTLGYKGSEEWGIHLVCSLTQTLSPRLGLWVLKGFYVELSLWSECWDSSLSFISYSPWTRASLHVWLLISVWLFLVIQASKTQDHRVLSIRVRAGSQAWPFTSWQEGDWGRRITGCLRLAELNRMSSGLICNTEWDPVLDKQTNPWIKTGGNSKICELVGQLGSSKGAFSILFAFSLLWNSYRSQ